MQRKLSKSFSLCQDKSLEAEASDALGGVYQLMADNETALQVGAYSQSQCFPSVRRHRASVFPLDLLHTLFGG